jgi:hypothetical protein
VVHDGQAEPKRWEKFAAQASIERNDVSGDRGLLLRVSGTKRLQEPFPGKWARRAQSAQFLTTAGLASIHFSTKVTVDDLANRSTSTLGLKSARVAAIDRGRERSTRERWRRTDGSSGSRLTIHGNGGGRGSYTSCSTRCSRRRILRMCSIGQPLKSKVAAMVWRKG